MSAELDYSELRVAARSAAEALARFERTIRDTNIDAYREAKEQLISSVRCVALAESVLQAQEEQAFAEEAEATAQRAEDRHGDSLYSESVAREMEP